MPAEIGQSDRAEDESAAHFGFGVGTDLAAVVVDQEVHRKSAGYARERSTSNVRGDKSVNNGRGEAAKRTSHGATRK